jgi:hypothetical protein
MRHPVRSFLAFALLGTAVAVPALAQPSPSDSSDSPYAPCSNKPSQADTEAAHGAYIAGKGSFDEADYSRAIDYFKDAYRRDCTKNELLVIISRAYELQGNRREAVAALEAYVERAPTAPDVETQKRKIANLKRELVDQAAASASASASAAPPSTALPAPSASAAPSASVPEPAPSAPPPAPSSEPRGHSLYPWIVVGAGAAAVITGGILYGVGAGQVSTAEGVCPNHECPGGPTDPNIATGNAGRSNETVGVVVGAAGLGVAAAGLAWHFLEPTGGAKEKAGLRPVVTPALGPGYAGLGVQGAF